MSKSLERWFDTKGLNPFRMEDPFDRLFNRMLSESKVLPSGSAEFAPSCDVSEDDKSYMMKFDLPGVKKDQVKVEAAGNVLTVTAERGEEKKEDTKKRHLSEIYYGSYSRSFSLPKEIDESKIDAKFENGVLTVTVPKAESYKAKAIPVQ